MPHSSNSTPSIYISCSSSKHLSQITSTLGNIITLTKDIFWLVIFASVFASKTWMPTSPKVLEDTLTYNNIPTIWHTFTTDWMLGLYILNAGMIILFSLGFSIMGISGGTNKRFFYLLPYSLWHSWYKGFGWMGVLWGGVEGSMFIVCARTCLSC